MTPALLASLIISFCGIKSQRQMISDDVAYACSNFMVNCAISVEGKISDELVKACQDTFRDMTYEEKQKADFRPTKEIRKLQGLD